MKKLILKKPNTLRTSSIKRIALYEELLDVHEPRNDCKSKCPTKCESCRNG